MKKSYILSILSIFLYGFSQVMQAQVTAVGCTISSSNYSSAIGRNTVASGKYSLASGYGVKALAENSFIFGTIPTGAQSSDAIVSNNTKNSFLIVFGGKPLFFARLSPLSSKENSGFSTNGLNPGVGTDPGAGGTDYSGSPAIGIGTIDPEETLDVHGNIKADTIKIKNSIFMSNDELSLTYYESGGTSGGGVVPFGTETDTTTSKEGRPIEPGFSSGVRTLLTLKKADGNPLLGVGTTDPKATLHVSGVGRFESSVHIHQSIPPPDIAGARLFVGGSTYITSGGLVVGNTQLVPNYKLQIEGNSYFGGSIGIGTFNPLTKMQIGDIWTFHDGYNDKIIGRNSYYNGSNNVRIQQGVASRIYFGGSGNIVLQTAASGNANSVIDGAWHTVSMTNDGKVGIGTDSPTKKLHVVGDGYLTGKMHCTEVLVTAPMHGGESGWPDYVFADDYSLMSLAEVASFIKENSHLPEVPSAVEVGEKGVNLGAMNAVLLKKVEELTLYILQQEKNMIDLQRQIDELKNQ